METHSDVKAKVDSKKWFYTETVKEHFFKPQNFLDGDEEEKYRADGRGMVGSPACIFGNTQIKTLTDQKSIESLKINDSIWGHDNKENKIIKVFNPQFSGKLVRLKNQFGEVFLTDDHLIYAIKIPDRSVYARNSYKKKLFPSWVHSGDIEKGDICLYPINNVIKEFEHITIKKSLKKFDNNSKNIPERVPLTEELLRFMGYFIAEGSTRSNGGEISFNFGIKEKDLANDVSHITKKLFHLDSRINIRKKNNKMEVIINSIHLSRYLRENFGDHAHNKRIPEKFMYINLNLQKNLIYGMWKGDGYISFKGNKPRAEFSTVSKKLAQQIKELLLRQQINHSLYIEKAKKIRGVNHKECFRLHVGEFEALKRMAAIMGVHFNYPHVSRISRHTWFDDNYFYMPIRKVEKIDFNGRLHNIEVEPSHSYISDAFSLHNCGDMMSVWIKVDKKQDKIKEMKWKTFGCASALASTSMLSVMVSENGGMPIDKALEIKPQDIVKRLGELPARKFHCSVLGDKALRAAINDYFRKSGQIKRMVAEGSKIVDKETGITDKDIEEAVLEGADTLIKIQQKLKVGVSNKSCVPEVEELMRFYKEKYFGKE